jgi:8-oxo-dGTP diphosphatase
LSIDITLKEHEAAKWLSTDELNTIKWLPIDLKVIEKIREEVF